MPVYDVALVLKCLESPEIDMDRFYTTRAAWLHGSAVLCIFRKFSVPKHDLLQQIYNIGLQVSFVNIKYF